MITQRICNALPIRSTAGTAACLGPPGGSGLGRATGPSPRWLTFPDAFRSARAVRILFLSNSSRQSAAANTNPTSPTGAAVRDYHESIACRRRPSRSTRSRPGAQWPRGIDVPGGFDRWKTRLCVPTLRSPIELLATESTTVNYTILRWPPLRSSAQYLARGIPAPAVS
jgi:hypothetical protein